MKTETWAISKLMADPANVRLHPAENLAAIKASLARFGQQKPIVVDAAGCVVAGNGTLAAARELGWDTLAVVVTKLEGVDRVAYAIADNRTNDLSEFDEPELAKLLAAIDDPALQEATGFDLGSIMAFEPSLDSQPQLDQKAMVKCPECGHEF